MTPKALIDPTLAPTDVPLPILKFHGDLIVLVLIGGTKRQRYPMEFWELAAGYQYAIVSMVVGNTSLKINSEKVASVIGSQWDVEGIIEYWPDKIQGQTFVQSGAGGGNGSLDFADFKRRGLVFPETHC